MAKKQNSFRLGIGMPSLFMIFVILVMCVLAMLAYLKAHSFYESTYRQAMITQNYYQSETELMNIYFQLDVTNIEKQLKKSGIDYQKKNHQYLLIQKMNDDFQLEMMIEVKNQALEIISLKKVSQRG